MHFVRKSAQKVILRPCTIVPRSGVCRPLLQTWECIALNGQCSLILQRPMQPYIVKKKKFGSATNKNFMVHLEPVVR